MKNRVSLAMAVLMLLLAACPGPQGDPGKDGINGKDGAPGQPGQPGENGLDGQQGQQGQSGQNGQQGQPGQPGQNGQQGQQGQPGAPGTAAAVMTPLWLGNFPVILEDKRGLLQSQSADWIQDALAAFANDPGNSADMDLLTGRENSNLRIIIEYGAPPYENDLLYRVINGRTLAFRYDFVATRTEQSQLNDPISDALRAASDAPLTAGLIWNDELVWSDEFDGDSLDTAKWNIELGNGQQYNPDLYAWGNNELQYYRAENISVRDGKLIIEAKKETYGGMSYTSGRLTTGGVKGPGASPLTSPEKYAVKMGRAEARIKAPRGRGFWPVFWLLGANYTEWSSSAESVFWPACGEIDIFEMNCIDDETYHATIHHGKSWPSQYWFNTGEKTHSASLADDWHVYGVQWDAVQMQFYMDDDIWRTINLTTLQGGANANAESFTKDLSIIFSLSVGGNYLDGQVPYDAAWIGPPEDRCLEVDWVRVYEKTGG